MLDTPTISKWIWRRGEAIPYDSFSKFRAIWPRLIIFSTLCNVHCDAPSGSPVVSHPMNCKVPDVGRSVLSDWQDILLGRYWKIPLVAAGGIWEKYTRFICLKICNDDAFLFPAFLYNPVINWKWGCSNSYWLFHYISSCKWEKNVLQNNKKCMSFISYSNESCCNESSEKA